MKKVTTKTTVAVQQDEFELSPQQLVMWRTLSRKAAKAYKYHQERISELLAIAETVAIDFEYV